MLIMLSLQNLSLESELSEYTQQEAWYKVSEIDWVQYDLSLSPSLIISAILFHVGEIFIHINLCGLSFLQGNKFLVLYIKHL